MGLFFPSRYRWYGIYRVLIREKKRRAAERKRMDRLARTPVKVQPFFPESSGYYSKKN